MSDSKTETLKGTIKGDAGRRARLAAELRENLKRRKAQARALGGAETDGGAATERDTTGRD